MSVCVIDYINVEYIGNFKEEKEFNQRDSENKLLIEKINQDFNKRSFFEEKNKSI